MCVCVCVGLGEGHAREGESKDAKGGDRVRFKLDRYKQDRSRIAVRTSCSATEMELEPVTSTTSTLCFTAAARSTWSEPMPAVMAIWVAYEVEFCAMGGSSHYGRKATPTRCRAYLEVGRRLEAVLGDVRGEEGLRHDCGVGSMGTEGVSVPCRFLIRTSSLNPPWPVIASRPCLPMSASFISRANSELGPSLSEVTTYLMPCRLCGGRVQAGRVLGERTHTISFEGPEYHHRIIPRPPPPAPQLTHSQNGLSPSAPETQPRSSPGLKSRPLGVGAVCPLA